MRTSVRLSLGVGALALTAAAAAFAQQRPESILPPGFGEPPQASPTPGATPRASATPGQTVQTVPGEASTPSDEPSATPSAPATPDAELLAEYELPKSARRSLALVGPVGAGDGGLDADAFGAADGRMLERLMRGFSGRLASRWMEITLRRALVSAVDTPRGVNGADFAAERAWLLLRLGESVAARAVTQSVDSDNYTPKLYQVAMQAALATGDPAAFCPLVDAAEANAPEPAWTLAKPICVALSGTGGAASLLAAARRAHVAGGIDLKVAEKVAGAGGQGHQAVTIEWDQVDRLTAWRFGLATATGVEIPQSLYDTAGAHLDGWRALSPMIPLAKRIDPAERAGGRGVLSNAALVDLFSALDEADDDAARSITASDLRDAYTAASAETRRAALARLWGEDAGRPPRYERLVLTARAAALVVPAAKDADADRLVAAMLSAGLDRTAARWRGKVEEGGDAWAMLLLADPDARERIAYGAIGRYSGAGDAALKQRLLFAGLAGLGRLSPADIERGAQSFDVKIGAENSWTRAIDRAAREREPGTVALLAAIGMQTPLWRGVSPEALYRIVGGLRAAGLEGPARMIAAEAIARA